MDSISFMLNGESIEVTDLDPNTTLLQFLRDHGWTGTKEGCAEGECGACAVVLVEPDEAQGSQLVAVNSCLMLLGAVADREVWTVEGVASEHTLHPVQRAMADGGGSQCGYCTPGFVMSLYAEYYRKGRTGPDLESIAGNLCRCTGYRPIRDALRGLPIVDASKDTRAQRLEQAPPALNDLSYGRGDRRFLRPTSMHRLWQDMDSYPMAKLVAGGTDVAVEMNQVHKRHVVLISLDAIPELREVVDDEEYLTIGAGVPLAEIELQLRGKIEALDQLWPLFSSRLIRRRATLGGNLVNASPIGDSPPVLLALDAEVLIADRAAERWVPLDGFFTGYRQTQLKSTEILKAVRIPKPYAQLTRFYKVSKRVADDISTVAAGFAIDRDENGAVTKARIAFGGVAATPVRLHAAEATLVGRALEQGLADAQQEALNAVTPIDDHRGSAKYRHAMVASLLAKLVAEMEVAA